MQSALAESASFSCNSRHSLHFDCHEESPPTVHSRNTPNKVDINSYAFSHKICLVSYTSSPRNADCSSSRLKSPDMATLSSSSLCMEASRRAA